MDKISEHFIQTVVSYIEKHSLENICDYGCGAGGMLKAVSEKLSHPVSLTGIDRFSLFSEEHRPVSDETITFVDKDSETCEKLFKKRKKFDLIISTFALHHFEHPVTELQNISKLLKKGGYIILLDMNFHNNNPAQITKNIHSFIMEIIDAFRGYFHRHHYTRDQALDLFKCIPVKICESNDLYFKTTEKQRVEEAKSFLAHSHHLRKNAEQIKSKIVRQYISQNISFCDELLKAHGFDSEFFMITARKK